MIDATLQNFETEVIAASMTTPVLVDFWADWCGPCKSLGPVLEKLEVAYEGRFKLVKVNADAEQQLVGAFGVRSLPTCVLLMNGQPVDGFMGAVPEGQLRAFLDKHLPSPEELMAEAETEEAEQLMQAGDTDAAMAKLQEALAVNPANEDARFDYVKLLVMSGELEQAAHALAPALAVQPVALRFEALVQWMACLRFVTTDPRGQWPIAQFDAAIAANKRDFEARFDKARVMIAMGEWPQAMDELLEIIMRDKAWGDQAPRKAYVALLELMTPPRPKADPASAGKTASGIEIAGKAQAQQDPQAELVSRYRRKLSMALN